MKIVNIIGGLGNQMFQYAFAVSLKAKFPKEEIFLDIQHFNVLFVKNFKGRNVHYGFELDKILQEVALPVANKFILRKVTRYIPNYWLSRIARKLLPKKKTEFIDDNFGKFSPEVYYKEGDCYYEGYWQSAKYFTENKTLIKKSLRFKEFTDLTNVRLSKKMLSENSVAIHVRRGDYLQQSLYKNIATIEYYHKSIQMIKSIINEPIFYVFSNDLEWCKENMQPLLEGYEITYLSHNKGNESFRDIMLMCCCKGMIIANSSFSWWAAFLNERDDNVICAPKKWINMHGAEDIQDSSWILI